MQENLTQKLIMEEALGYLSSQIIGAGIGALIGAIFIRVATKIAAGFTPTYGTAYLAAFFGYTASVFSIFIAGIIFGLSDQTANGSSVILMMIIGFFVQAGVYSLVLNHPDTGNITFGQACLVSFIQIVMTLLIVGIVAIIAIAVTN